MSSVIRDFGAFRDAAAKAITDLGHEALRVESLGARDATPEQACLQLERDADALVLLLGPRYGPIQASGLSATHEEYRDARDRAPVLVFVHAMDGDPEPRQREFIAEVKNWSSGRLTQTFATPDELRAAVTRQLHELELSRAAGPVNAAEIAARAVAATEGRDWRPRNAALMVAVAAGPTQQLVRPAQMDEPGFRRQLLRRALTGTPAVLDPHGATKERTDGDDAVLEQERAALRLDGLGTLTVLDPHVEAPSSPGHFGGMVLLEDDIRVGISAVLVFAGQLLEEIDPTHRATAVAPVAVLVGIEHTMWRTRAEHAADPNRITPNMFGPARALAGLTPPTRPRAALLHEPDALADDLLVLLRRQAIGAR